MNATTSRTVTAEELLRMPEDGFRYDLVKGELRKMSPAGSRHGNITMRLGIALGQYIEANDLGEIFAAETGFKLASDPDTIRAPDIAFVRRERIPAGDMTEKFWPGPPDLAVEVISPHDTLYEVDEKVEDYLAAGVRMIWIVNPKRRTITVHNPQSEPQTLAENDVLDGQDVIPGFQHSIAKLFVAKH